MKLLDFIIAEDIRFETGNKYSIMGIYNETIGLNRHGNKEWPMPFRFGIYIRLKSEKNEDILNRFVLAVRHNGKNIAHMEGKAQPKESQKTMAIPLVLSPFPLPGYGKLDFELQLYKDKSLLHTERQTLEVTDSQTNTQE